ncbi:MAG: mechanosensitive ion channel [Opitutales bacterium]|nr:mechanosensitive ion channel [Opitutales bacterium]
MKRWWQGFAVFAGLAATARGEDNGDNGGDGAGPLTDVPGEAEPLVPVSAESMVWLMDRIIEWVERAGAGGEVARIAAVLTVVVFIGCIAVIANWIAKKIILRVIDNVVSRTPWKWDNTLRDNRVFARLSHLAPAAVINLLGKGLFLGNETVMAVIHGVVMVYVVAILLLVVSAVINTIQQFIEMHVAEEGVPVKGFAQAIKLVVFIIGAIFILSIIFGQSPLYFLSGLGALTAVMLLIFRDALLGLVAGVMISVNEMVRVGDWIEMPSNGADGNVIDVSLTTVKVRNWDRTITTVPSYDLISKSFKNWRGMFENKGRRMKRPIHIDMQTIGFVDKPMLERFMRIKRLRPYLEAKLQEVEESNEESCLDMEVLCNGRRLTNLGTFRAYCLAYLKDHPGVFQEELMIVRQLDPGEHGIPIEIYAFTNKTQWVAYEGIQSDIFDHLLSIVGEFGLRVFQEPSGHDLRRAFGSTASATETTAPMKDAPKEDKPAGGDGE